MTRAAIIGAGLGGLALGIRLQSAGLATTIVEAAPHPGGRLSAATGTAADPLHAALQSHAHPAPLEDPAPWRELWTQAGADFAAAVTLLPVPLRRLNWPDGTQFDWTADHAEVARAVARLAPGDLAGFETVLAQARDQATRRRQPRVQPPRRLHHQPSRLATLVHTLPDWLRAHGWRSLDRHAGTLVRSEKLRQALSFRPLLAGLNPLTAPATHAPAIADELDRGLWWPQGGMPALTAALAQLYTTLGGELRLGDPATRITTLGNRATALTCASGWHTPIDLIASSADPMHTAHTLLAGSEAAAALAATLRHRRWTPGRFTVHFALAGAWPGIAHDTILFANRWHDLLGDVFDRGVLPTDMIIRLLHPTVTDPTLVPPGHSLFIAQVPVAHLGLLPIDWEVTGPLMQRRVLDELGRRLIPDIHDRILVATHRTPRDDALDYNAWLGSAAGPEPCRLAELRADPPRPVANLWQVGTGAGAGATAGAVLAHARTTATRILSEHHP